MSDDFLRLDATDDPQRFRLTVREDLSVGPPGNSFLYGGAGLAVAIRAMERTLGRGLAWATTQYLSPARLGHVLDVVVTVAQAGRHVAQASVMALGDGGQPVFGALGALGGRGATALAGQWSPLPDMPPPAQCPPASLWPPQDALSRLHHRLDIRAAPGSLGTPGGPAGPCLDGRLRLWIRNTGGHAVDAAMLAIYADFVPAGVGALLGRVAGGTSLDNTLRVRRTVPTDWVLCDVHIAAIDRGLAHGDMRLFAEDGTLLALASQTMVVRTFDPPDAAAPPAARPLEPAADA